MKNTLKLLCVFLFCSSFCWAQEVPSKNLIYGDLSFGFETDQGNTGLLFGLGYQRNLSRKIIFQVDIQNFRTGIIDNNWQYKKSFPKEIRYDHSAFLSAAIGYAVIGKNDKFNITVKGGYSLCHIKSKNNRTFVSKFYPKGTAIPNLDPGYVVRDIDPSIGTEVVIPSSISYSEENIVALGYNFGVDVNIPIKKKHFLTVSFISYSQDSPLQYFFCVIPVFSYKIKI